MITSGFARIRHLLFAGALLAAFTVPAVAQVVISQVYGGGQGAAATYKNDFVELFNPTGSDVALTGWTVQYQPSGSTGAWSGKVALSGTIAAHKYFLVQMSPNTGSGTSALDLPTPDVASTAVSMSATAGKVALSSGSTTLSTTVGPPVVCPSGVSVSDLVGYGAANCSETSPTAAPATATAVLRAGAGCTDTGSNLADFSVGAPTPRNSASAANVCTVVLSGTGSASPSTVTAGNSTTLTASVTPGVSPASTGIAVNCNLTGIGGSAAVNLPNTTGNTYSVAYAVPGATASQTYSLPCSVTDSQSRSATFSIALTVSSSSTPPTATGTASPSSLVAGASTLLSAAPVSGGNPASSTYTLACNLTTIGGGASVALPVSYAIPAAQAPANYSLPCTVTDDLSRSSGFNIALTVQAPAPTTHLIYEITGSGVVSPLAGASVTTRGVVTAVRGTTGTTQGFYLESVTADRDSDPNTSEGLLVFTGSTAVPACAVVGNNVQLQGMVSDFVPSTSPVGTVPLTELASISNCTILSTNALASLPAAVTIDNTVIVAGGSGTQARKLVGMRVAIPVATVVGPGLGTLTEPSATATPNGQFFVSVQGVSRPFRTPGIQVTRRPSDAAGTVPSWNGSPEALRVDTTGLTGGTTFEVATGTTVTGLSGIMDYNTSQSQYQIYTNAAGTGTLNPSSPTLAAIPIPAPLGTDLLVVNANIERFFNDLNDGNGNSVLLTTSAYQGRLNKLSLGIRNVLHLPDIITMEEVEGPGPNDPQNYPVPQDIVNKLNADAATNGQGSPNYTWCQYPTNDIGQISASIIYRQDRVSLVSCSQFGLATNYSTPGGGTSLLNDRPPVVLVANVKAAGSDSGLQVRIVGNHLRSLSGIDEPGAANGDRVRTKRNEQAKYLGNLVSGNLTEQTSNWSLTDNLLVAGDMNSFDVNDGFSDSVNCFAGSPAPANQEYLTAAQLAVSARVHRHPVAFAH